MFVGIYKKPKNLSKFDTKEFCPSIKEPLLENDLKFTEEYICITADSNTKNQSCSTKAKRIWKRIVHCLGVAMGAFDGTEVWELLHKLSENYERINHAISNNVRGTVSKKKKKKKKKIL